MGDFEVWRVLVSAPSDMSVELDCVGHAIHIVNRSLEARGDRLRLELRHWRNHVIPGAHADTVQDLIEEQLRFHDCDILVGIFWTRLGTPVPGAPSGSAREINIAHESWKTSGRPHILTYFNTAPTSFGTVAEAENCVALLKFKEVLKNRNILLREYDGDREFERLLTSDLLARALGSSQEVEKASQSLFSCQMQASAPELRGEGFAEYAGDITLRFNLTNYDPSKSIREIREVDIDVSFDTRVVTLKNSPAPHIFVSEWGLKSALLDGRYIGDNSVRFERVPITFGSRVIVTDILLKAVDAAIVTSGELSEIHATATITEGVKQLKISGNHASVGTVRFALSFGTPPPPRLSRQLVIEGELSGKHTCVSYLNFRPGFPHAFRTRSNEAARLAGSLSEIQFLGRRADSGTRLAAVFPNLPPGIALYVTAWEEPLDGKKGEPKSMIVIAPNADGSGGTLYRDSDEAVAVTNLGIPLVRLEGPIAVWEWIDDAPYLDQASLRFGIIVTTNDRRQLSPIDILVSGSLAPFFTVHAYSNAADPSMREVAVVPCFVPLQPTHVALHIE